MNSEVPPRAERDDDTLESKNRREFLRAGLNTALGLFAVRWGLGTDDAAARGRGKKETTEEKTPEIKSYEPTPEQQEALRAYEARLSRLPLEAVHKKQGSTVLVEDIMKPPLVGVGEPTPEELGALLGPARTGLLMVPSFHRALLYEGGALVSEMPIGVGRHKDATEGEYYTPRGIFKARWKRAVHYSKYCEAYKVIEQNKYLPKRRQKRVLPYMYDMLNTVNFTGGIGVATHESSRFGTNKKGQETLVLDASHGCINLRPQDAQRVYETLQTIEGVGADKATPVIVLNDITSVTTEDLAAEKIDHLNHIVEEHVGRLRDTQEALDVRIRAQPNVANLITQIRRHKEFAVFADDTARMAHSVVHPRLFRNAEHTEEARASGVRASDNRMLLAKDGALRVFPDRALIVRRPDFALQGSEAEAEVTHIGDVVLGIERDGLLNGSSAFIVSKQFEDPEGVDAGGKTYTNVLPTFLLDPQQDSVLQQRIRTALLGHKDAPALTAQLDRGEVLAGVLRPEEFKAFADKGGVDRGEPVFVPESEFSSDHNKAHCVGLVLDWLPFTNEQGENMFDDDGQWGMVLISKPNATKRAIQEGGVE